MAVSKFLAAVEEEHSKVPEVGHAERGRSDPCIGEQVIIKAGDCKSLMGVVKDATENSLRIDNSKGSMMDQKP